MKFHKTNYNNRTSYTYPFVTGEHITIHPGDRFGDEVVVDVHIKTLYAFDDAEVYNNCKNHKLPLTNEEKNEICEWEAAHPGEKISSKWIISLDAFTEDLDSDIDRSNLMKEIYDRSHAENPVVDRLWEVIDDMPPKQRQVIVLVELRGYSMTEVADKMGCSIANVSKLVARAKEFIKKNY